MKRSDPSLLFLGGVLAVATALGGAAIAFRNPHHAAVSDPPCPGANGRTRELRACLSDAIVYVSTPLGAGSGVLLTDGHIVTNAHVVDPFARADVTFPGGERHHNVGVAGVDAFTDIAVLEPITTKHPGTSLRSAAYDEDEQPEVFLAGYPGGDEGDDPTITLSSGILSRLRADGTFGATYLQTDAAIGGGQSGGALVDGEGRILGISALSFADSFALALRADDVRTSVDKILGGKGDARRTVPTQATAGTDPIEFRLDGDHPAMLLIVPAQRGTATVHLDVASTRDVAVDVWTLLGEEIGMNQAAADIYGYGDDPTVGLGGPGELPSFPVSEPPIFDIAAGGGYTFDAPKEDDLMVVVSSIDERSADVTVDVDAPFVRVDDVRDGATVEIGTPLRGVVDGFTHAIIHQVALNKGDTVDITLRSPWSDSWFEVLAPGESEFDVGGPLGDDGAGGLFDVDAEGTYSAKESGTFRIIVGTYEGVVAGYQLSVERV